ncbi:flavoprotein [Labedaea rhizosphaerae]|uniref:Flavoprotein n=1 Tax=Labedaea rhizosphaerae TaxID=598644 RepID=A0A4V3CZV3_LABRH|nr:flavoprotein [Labedaea rhizosphaerae]TDQ01171.1 flavoprotein [Labedaea rhizosphaerae]
MILGLIASAGGGVERRLRPELAEPAVARGWTLAVTLTPTAARWLAATGELAKLQSLTDLPVRSEPRMPGQPKPYPMPSAFVFAPATANSVAKLALGIADSQALTAACEAVGARVPMVVRPQAGDAQRGHPAFAGHVKALREAGVLVSDEPPEVGWEPMLDLLEGP